MNPDHVKAGQEAVAAIAPLIGRYVAALVESGLMRAEALQLAQGLQQTAFQTALVLAQNIPAKP